ncbi:MAG: hypothetical protein N2114_01035 [Candidatus Goldbacteria bacterium]|nr:hypothetical protein [Candidatus Goldiibacteriota bacterium]
MLKNTFYIFFIIKTLLLSLFLNSSFASNEACWYKVKDSDVQIMMQCYFVKKDELNHTEKIIKIDDECEILWEGNVIFHNGKKVAHGEGFLTFIDKQGNRSKKISSKFKNGKLISDIDFIEIWPRIEISKPSKELADNNKGYVELSMQNNQYFIGWVTYDDSDKIRIKSLDKGVLFIADFIYYDGEFLNNAANGKGYACIGIQSEKPIKSLYNDGECPFPATFFSGIWKAGLFYKGYSRFLNEDGSYYEGDFENGSLHGYGKYVWADGSYYEGNFNRNMREGLGFYKYPDGSVYNGEWKENLKNGYGELIVQSEPGFIYKGDFLEGKFHGEGIIEFSDGMVYVGNFFENNPHGEGYIYFDETNVYVAVFENGELIRLESTNENKVSPYAFNIITSAYASNKQLAFLNNVKSRIKNAFNQAKKWVYENKEHLINAGKGCIAGAAGGAISGAAGGAVGGAIAGSIVPGAGTAAGAAAGAISGATFGAVSGCFDKAIDAFNYSQQHDGKYDFAQMQKVFLNETLNLENFLWGATGGVGKIAGPMIKASVKSYRSVQKVIEIQKGIKHFVREMPVVKQTLKITEKISAKSNELKNRTLKQLEKFKKKIENVTKKGGKSTRTRITKAEQEFLKNTKVSSPRKVVSESNVNVMTKPKNQINPNQKTTRVEQGKRVKKTNCQLMREGHPPVCKDGSIIELHHLKQQDVITKGIGTLVELCGSEHKQYYDLLHQRESISDIERENLNRYRSAHWKARAKEICK